MTYCTKTETRRLPHNLSRRKIVPLTIILLTISVLFFPPGSLSQPVIDVQPFAFDFEIGEEFLAEFQFHILNDGDEELVWHSHEFIVSAPNRLPVHDEPGDILGSFVWEHAGADHIKTGIAYDPVSELLFLTSFRSDYCGVLDPANDYAVVSEWNAGESLLGATCLNGIVYVVNSGHEWFEMWDIEGNNLGRLETEGYAPVTVTASPEANLLIFMDFDGSDCLNVMTPEGEIIGTIGQGELFDENPMGAIVWVENHRPGQLWFVSQHNHRVFQLDVLAREGDQINPGVIQSFDMPGVVNPHELDGIGHDGQNFILGIRGREDYLIVDDGIAEQTWLDWLPKTGRIDPASDIQVFGYIDMHGLVEGLYEAEIHLISNDLDEPDFVIYITVNVSGVPDLTLTWPEEAGYPDQIDYNAYNIDVWNGYESLIPLNLENTGTTDLDVMDVFFSIGAFSFDGEGFVLAPGESRTADLAFQPVQPILYEGSLFVRSSDYDNPIVEIPVRGRAFDPPVIQVERQDIFLQPEGNSQRCSIEIGNSGISALVWRGEIASIPPRNLDDSTFTETFIAPDSGRVEPDESSQIILTFLRNNLDVVLEDFLLTIFSNDPAHRIVTVEITIDWSLDVKENILPELPSNLLILKPPHPHPVNSTAEIPFYLPVPAPIEFGLYSLDGREVSRIIKQLRPSGWQTAVIDAHRIPTGVYEARLISGKATVAARVVVIK